MQTLGMMERYLSSVYQRTHFYSCTKLTSDHVLLDTASAPTWLPYLAKDINALEREQHHDTKLVKN